MLHIQKDGARIGQYHGTAEDARAWLGKVGLPDAQLTDARATVGAAQLADDDYASPLERRRAAQRAQSGDSPAVRLLDVLAARKVSAALLDTVTGPRTLRYMLAVAPDTAVSKLRRMEPDLGVALAQPVRVLAPTGSAGRVCIEVASEQARIVTLTDCPLPEPPLLTLPLGLSPSGSPVYAQLAELPHMLIAGATGSGKSVFLHSLLAALSANSPELLRLCLIDVKRVELTRWSELPHLIAPVAVELSDALRQLGAVLAEVQRRYAVLEAAGARSISEYSGELPRLLVVIDELADLVLSAPVAVDLLSRIAQIGRAAGVHIIAATQRPDSRVLSGLLKANIPARVAFATASHVDSRVILDATGAEKLLGRGDLLFSEPGKELQRAQACYVDSAAIEQAAGKWAGQAAEYWDIPVPPAPVSYLDSEDYKQRQAHIQHLTQRAGAATYNARSMRDKYDRERKLWLLWGLSAPVLLLLLAFCLAGDAASWGLLAAVTGGLSLWSQKIAWSTT